MNKEYTLVLRAMEPQDIDLLYAWENNMDLWKLGNHRIPFSRFDLEQYVLSSDKDPYTHKQVRFMIDLLDQEKQKRTIGNADLFDFDPANQRAGIGILIVAEERNKGYAHRALEQLIHYAFQVLNLHQLYANVLTSNTISIELFKKSNFKTIGLKKDWNLFHGQWEDEIMLQLINPPKQQNKK